MVHIVQQPFQAEGLRHLHAWHGVPERDCENLFKFACFTFPQPKYFESLQITCCPSYWQRKESAAALPGCLGAAEKSCNLTSCKKVAFCNFPRKLAPSLPPPISILCYSTCSSMSSSSLATTILNRSLESTTKMMPCKVDMSRVMKVRRSIPGSLCSSAPTGSCTCPGQTCQRQWSRRFCLKRQYVRRRSLTTFVGCHLDQ